jgi:hypothetical protein
VALVERHEDHAGARDRLVDLEVAVAVGRDDRDTVAGLHAEPPQRADEPPAAIGHLRVRQPHVAADDGGPVRRDLRGAAQRRDHRGHVAPPATRDGSRRSYTSTK